MNAQTQQPNQTGKAARRKRKAPRRVPAVIEQRERKPFIFGRGADLSNREREAIKERIALFGGVGIALVLLAILGWGWYQDNVAGPGAREAANNVPIARVGTYTIRTGFFKHFEKFQQNRINSQLTQIQQQLGGYQGQPKKYARQISQLQGEQSQLQQQLGSIPQNSLTGLITSQTVLQRSRVLGIADTPRDVDQAVRKAEQSAGGRLHLLQAITPAGLSMDDIRWLITADDLTQKVAKKLASQVPRNQTKVRASHILIPAKKKSLAQTLDHKALKGADFVALAKQYSTDPGSAKNGGDLGFFTRDRMVKPFANAAFSMKVGQIRLVKSQFGWHVIKVTARRYTHLTPQEYSQAQQTAFNNWIQKQQAVVGITRYRSPPSVPNTSPTSPVGGLPGHPVPGH